ncbi:Pol polyprotein [Vitis vinifera]|uniref:Pol polyprotein n=1 Tax=Vitis vinifera TaxID=29760 RepID=A0A438FUH3_VITVI|nr:Pol polyprotein [Vitis vinifera]
MADFVLEYSRRPPAHESSEQVVDYELTEPHASSGSGVGLLLQSPTGEHLEQAIRLGFSASNNEAEYEAILSGLDLALALSVSKLRIYSDSQLVVRHVQKEYEAKDSRMARYLAKVRSTLQQFTEWTIEKIKRADNGALTLGRYSCFPPIKEAILLPIHVQANPSVAEIPLATPLRQTKRIKNGRMILQNISGQALYPKILNKHKIRVQAARFTLIGGTCTSDPSQGLIFAVLGIQRPTLKSVSGPWPFAQWGMDIVGPLPAAPAQKKFLLVATDYFSKWVEAEAYASIKDKDVTKFVWKNIVCRFGIPQIIIADNGPQFDSIAFRNFCSELNIRNSYSTPLSSKQWAGGSHKQNSNQCLKEKAEQAKGKWVEELPGVLWAYRTTPGRPTGNTPFALTYGMDAVIPTEIGLPTIRTDAAKQKCQHGTRKKFGLGRRSQRKRHPDGRLSTKGISALQSKSQAQKLQKCRAASPPPHVGGPQLILLDSSPQPTPPEGFIFLSHGG